MPGIHTTTPRPASFAKPARCEKYESKMQNSLKRSWKNGVDRSGHHAEAWALIS